MSMRTALFLTLAILPAAAGCVKKESVDSQDVTTHGMSLEMDVINDGTKSKVYAALHVGSYESLVWAKLSSGDQLIVIDPTGAKQQLSVIYEGNKTAYGADLAAMDGEFKLDFIRAKGASALGNKLMVPKAFTLAVSAPAVSRKEMLSFSWGASNNGDMAYSLSGPCISAHAPKTITGDPGTFTINAGEIKAVTGKEMETCQLTLKVTRSITSKSCCSAEFGHTSYVRGIQERVITFNSTP
jgi:hypothetical protein